MSTAPVAPMAWHGEPLLGLHVGAPAGGSLRARPPFGPRPGCAGRIPNHRIERLLAEEDVARVRIDEIDAALVDLAAERRRLLERIRDLHHELRPPVTNVRDGVAGWSAMRKPSRPSTGSRRG